jgi:hypothetical protein
MTYIIYGNQISIPNSKINKTDNNCETGIRPSHCFLFLFSMQRDKNFLELPVVGKWAFQWNRMACLLYVMQWCFPS